MREEFERWYLKVVRGHPNNLAKGEDGGYKYLGAMFLAWEAATMIEREACAKVCEDKAAEWAPGEKPAQWQLECARFIQLRSNANPR